MKKGFTLVEVIIAAALALLLALFIVKFFIKITLNYQEDLYGGRSESSVTEAFLFIQNKLNHRVKNIDLIGDKLKISLSDNINTEQIYFKQTYENLGNIQIQYYRFGSSLAINNIITDIKSFNLVKENNVIYLSITDKGGKCIERCFSIRR